MRSVVLTATLLTTLWLGAPAVAVAQEPDPAPAPAPAPPPPPRESAVPRAERPERAERAQVREPEVRVRETESPGHRTPSRGDRAPMREPQPVAASGSTTPDDEQRRDGAVRRPPSDGGRGGGRANGGRPRDREDSNGGRADDSGRGDNSTAGMDRAVPRTTARQPERVYAYPDYYRNYNRYYDPWGYGGFGLGYFYYSPWGWNPNYHGYGYGPSYGYGGYGSGSYGSGSYGYGGGRYSSYGYDAGSVKLKVRPRDAEVYVDGYFAGHVDDFDGVLQSLKLDSGAYRLEIRKAGFETLHFDVRVQPERSVTFRGDMRPRP